MFTFKGMPITNGPANEASMNVWFEAFGLKKRPADLSGFTDERTRDIETDSSLVIPVQKMIKFPVKREEDVEHIFGYASGTFKNIPLGEGYNRFDIMVIARYIAIGTLEDNWNSVMFSHDHGALKLLAENNPGVFTKYEIIHAEDEEKEEVVVPKKETATKKEEAKKKAKEEEKKEEKPKQIAAPAQEKKKKETKKKVETVKAEIVPNDSKAGFSAKNVTAESKLIESKEEKAEEKQEEKPVEEKKEEAKKEEKKYEHEEMFVMSTFDAPRMIKQKPELKDKTIDRLLKVISKISEEPEYAGIWSCKFKLLKAFYMGPNNFGVSDPTNKIALWIRKDDTNLYAGEHCISKMVNDINEYRNAVKKAKEEKKKEEENEKQSA